MEKTNRDGGGKEDRKGEERRGGAVSRRLTSVLPRVIGCRAQTHPCVLENITAFVLLREYQCPFEQGRFLGTSMVTTAACT